MKFDYNIEINSFLNKIYEHKVYEIAYENNLYNIDAKVLKDKFDLLKNTKIYLGSDMHEFIINLIPKGKDGYYFRCEIANYHNYSFPRLYDYKGEPLKNTNYNRYGVQLWESHMNDLLIEDIEGKFNQADFIDFIDNNLLSLICKINEYIKSRRDKEKIVIKFEDKSEILDIVKSLILNGGLDLSYAEFLTDMDKLRDEMIKFSTPFHMYNEFDKLEDDTLYCLDNFCKYNSLDLFDALINEKGFKFIDGVGLVKE
ncbi:hypothetical protein [Romboutsia sp. 1001713B170131_170501_G6]|uniref:hypothetical protein n=1 Tax=Romboutsia sp. 1001713B170131_170501_G6 TaxID=2787108 RepID=UPI0018AACD86|nr:hypothetical protein [Romboutsia sp. 1001713B170131_170501_G6]